MKTFLQYCAEDIYNKYADSLNELCIVFPNNRARLFFVEALYKQAGKAIWAPEFSSISELFGLRCPLELGDPILLNSLLFKVYQKQGLDKESFDDFYPWGNLLLKDFDNIDKNLADAGQLFRNISELAAYSDDFEYLSPEQIAAIQRFFAHFETDRSELKKRFIRLWNELFNIYTQFKEELTARNMAYEGMLHRWVVEHFDDKQAFEANSYLFVGFNALSGCEKFLFGKLQKAGKARFYWDYDRYYLNNPGHEAGHFIRENLKLFPNELNESCFDNWKQTAKKIQFIDSSTEHAQVHYAGIWMEQNASKAKEVSLSTSQDTAIVLCNENLLPGLLQCVPSQIEELNVTMGYPVKQTSVYHLIRQVLFLHCDNRGKKTFRSRYVLPLLQNPYVRKCSPEAAALEKELRIKNRLYPEYDELQQDDLLSLLFSPVKTAYELGELLLKLFSLLSQTIDNDDETGTETGQKDNKTNEIYLPLFQEALFKSYTQVQRLNALLKKDLLEINLQTYKNLLLQVLDLSVPFSGEPLNGLQIMGMLETRCLDFKNILMLSVNEGQIPKNRAENSFIPYNLRRAFNLSGPEHQDAISAYYFFRALQRAENITLVYNSSTEGLNRGEMSRFMLQLAIESKLPIEILHLSSEIKTLPGSSILVPKTPALIQQLYDMYDQAAANTNSQKRYLSPSMLNTYLDCRLKYYFQYLRGLKKEEEISEQMDPLCFGTIFHAAAQYLYVKLILQKNGRKHSHENILASMEDIRAFNLALKAPDSPAGFLNRNAATGERLNEKIETDKQFKERIDTGEQLNGRIEAADLQALYTDKACLERAVDYFMAKEFFRLKDGQSLPALNGEQLIQRRLLVQFLKFLLKLDQNYAPFELLGLETFVEKHMELHPNPGRKLKLRVGGIIDRMDKKDETIRICDYKTGGKAESASFDKGLFKSDQKRNRHVFQTFLYAGIVKDQYPASMVKPELVYIHQAGKPDYSSDIVVKKSGKSGAKTNGSNVVNDFGEFKETFETELQNVVGELFDPAESFDQTSVLETCEHCDFNTICRRK
jgi:hypothetical protein